MRNYAVEMRELIDKETDEGPYEPVAVASKIVAVLQATDPDLLDGYLRAHAVQIIREAINRRDQSARMVARKGAASARMKEILDSISSGEVIDMPQVRAMWLNTTFTLADGRRHELRSMRRVDLVYVAEDYERRASENRMEASFMRALAKRCTEGKTVGDILTEPEIVAIRETLSQFK